MTKKKQKTTRLPDTQEEEMTLANEEGRQPRCIYCKHPIELLRQTQYENIRWTWNKTTKKFDKDQDGTSDAAYHSCKQCSCEMSDWDFVDEVMVDY